MKKAKKSPFLRTLDSTIVLFGMLSNFGIAIVSVVFLDLLSTLTKISTGNIFLDVLIPHTFISIAIFFIIGKSKSFKIGYLLGFVLIVMVLVSHAFTS